jgi:hypothetical protein
MQVDNHLCAMHAAQLWCWRAARQEVYLRSVHTGALSAPQYTHSRGL